MAEDRIERENAGGAAPIAPRHGQAPIPLPYLPDAPAPAPQPARQLSRKRARRRRLGLRFGCMAVVLGSLLGICGFISIFAAGAALIFLPQVEAAWSARVAEIDGYRGFQSTFVYDRHGSLLYEAFSEGRREHVAFARIPESLINATVAIEDDSFFRNIGIDIGATAIAALNYLGAPAGAITPGGSTITQQLARNIFFDYEKRIERSVSRKMEEIALAIVLTQAKSKEDILEMYFNEIYYGNLAYGVQTAAQTFFGKDVDQLTLGEAALLAGLPQAPASLDPLNPDPAVQAAVNRRWRLVLGEMVEEAYISPAEEREALLAGLAFAPAQVSLTAPHFTVYALGELERLMTDLGYSPESITSGGLRVYTTLDQAVNQLAQQAAANQVAQLAAKNVSNAAVIVTKPSSGEIIAMIGSIDATNEAIDGSVNVTIAFRQPGSTIKPFTYAAAMERGLSTLDLLWDTPTEIDMPGQPAYAPRNYDKRFHGPMTLRTALANSYNIPAVQTLRLIGVPSLLEVMQRFGISTLDESASQYGLSLTLGGGEITLIELTNAYAVFANRGDYVPVTSILCVVDSAGQILYQYSAACPAGAVTAATANRAALPQTVLDPRIAYVISDVLADNQARAPAMGAYSPLRTDGIASAVKTGTTDDVKDNWTIGYTHDVAVGVWVGNNDGEPMIDSSGLTGAAPIWHAVLTGIYGNTQLQAAFAENGSLRRDWSSPPPGLRLRQACDASQLKAYATDCPATFNEWQLDGPAGVPDGAGGLQYPPALQVYPSPVPRTGSHLQQVAPGIYRAMAYPVPPELAASIQFRVNPGEQAPLPPNFCRVPMEDASQAVAAGARHYWFIAGPRTSSADAVEAERYAREHGLAYLPPVDCWLDLYNYQPVGSIGAQLQITQPANGQLVRQPMPILGTVLYDSSLAENYHMYIRGGHFTDWTPLGQPQYQQVSRGQLEYLHSDSLPPGNYALRLALVRDGHFVQVSDVLFGVP